MRIRLPRVPRDTYYRIILKKLSAKEQIGIHLFMSFMDGGLIRRPPAGYTVSQWYRFRGSDLRDHIRKLVKYGLVARKDFIIVHGKKDGQYNGILYQITYKGKVWLRRNRKPR